MDYTTLMNDRWSWAYAWKYNNRYQLNMQEDDIRAEIYGCVAAVFNGIETGKFVFRWSDDEQVLKYFRGTVKYLFNDHLRSKIKDSCQRQYDDVGWEEVSLQYFKDQKLKETIRPLSVIQSLDEDRIYRYILRYCKNLPTLDQKLRRIYKKFGQEAIKLIYRCKYVLELGLNHRTKREVSMSEKFKGLYPKEVEWICHLISMDQKKDPELKSADLTKDMVLGFAKRMDNPFGRRLIKWVSIDLAVDPGQDCFSLCWDVNDPDCKGCADFDNCKVAHSYFVAKEPAVQEATKTPEVKPPPTPAPRLEKTEEKKEEKKETPVHKVGDDELKSFLAGVFGEKEFKGRVKGACQCWVTGGTLNMYLSKEAYEEFKPLQSTIAVKDLKNDRKKVALAFDVVKQEKIVTWLKKWL